MSRAECVLKVHGMVCGACATRVQMVAKRVDGVGDVVVSHGHGTAHITYDSAKTNPVAIAPGCHRPVWLHIGGHGVMFRRLGTALIVCCGLLSAGSAASASGHGPMFGMTTPTNAAGGWAIDFGTMGRIGQPDNSATSRTMLTFGITEDLQVSGSVPYVFGSAPLPAGRMTGMMPGGGDVEGLVAWRFHRQGTNVGARFESTAYGGVIVPGPQKPAGVVGTFDRTAGLYTGAATGFASRGTYVWVGAGYTRFAQTSVGDRRSSVVSYSAVWGYRPQAMRKEYPHWDWRGFVEMTGEKSSAAEHFGTPMVGTDAHQVFIGPSVLGIYKNYAIQAGVQLPAYRNAGARVEEEKFRYATNFSYFF